MKHEELERMWANDKNWSWWGYHCPEDPRIIVPKRPQWMGWTLNFSQRSALPVLLLTMLVVGAPAIATATAGDVSLRAVAGTVIGTMCAIVVLVILCHWESTRPR